MAVSSMDLCSRALIKIGANGITSFEEGTAEAQVAASIYPIIRDGMLSAHPWNFATAQARLAQVSSPPLVEYESAFALPGDCLRVLSAGSGGRGRGLSYRILGNLLCTAGNDATVTYVFRPNEDDFPPFFSVALIARLSAEFCIPLTDSTSRWTSLYKIAEEEFRRAKLTDALEDSPQHIDSFPLTEVRS